MSGQIDITNPKFDAEKLFNLFKKYNGILKSFTYHELELYLANSCSSEAKDFAALESDVDTILSIWKQAELVVRHSRFPACYLIVKRKETNHVQGRIR